MREFLLYCVDCDEYTALGKFLKEEGHFEGEYSLLHNRRMNGDDLLGRFLLGHLGHCLKAHPSGTKAYSDILKSAGRFMDNDLDDFIEQAMKRDEEQRNDLLMERGLGQLQLHIVKKMLTDETEAVSKTRTKSPAEGQFMLGKEEGLKKALTILDDMMEKTDRLYL